MQTNQFLYTQFRTKKVVLTVLIILKIHLYDSFHKT